MAFDRFNDKPARRENRFSDRGPREDRFGGDRPRFGGERKPFGERKSFGDRPSSGGRFGGRDNRFDGDRPRFSEDRPRFNDERPRFGGDRAKFGARRDASSFGFKPSGPRAKAFEVRRHTDRNAFVQTATVRLDADVAEFFKTPEAVNGALRQLIALARGIMPVEKSQQEAATEEVVTEEQVVAEEKAEELLTASSTEADE